MPLRRAHLVVVRAVEGHPVEAVVVEAVVAGKWRLALDNHRQYKVL